MLKTEGVGVGDYGKDQFEMADEPEFFDSGHQMQRQSSRYTISNLSVNPQRVVSRANREVDYFNKIGAGLR